MSRKARCWVNITRSSIFRDFVFLWKCFPGGNKENFLLFYRKKNVIFRFVIIPKQSTNKYNDPYFSSLANSLPALITSNRVIINYLFIIIHGPSYSIQLEKQKISNQLTIVFAIFQVCAKNKLCHKNFTLEQNEIYCNLQIFSNYKNL